VQYGLSVKQFTGQNPKYWEKLPSRIKNAQGNSKELKKIIVELEQLAQGSDERRKKRRAQFKRWPEKEIIINAQLVPILAALPETLLAETLKKLVKNNNAPNSCRIVDLYMQGEKGEHADFVEPDLLLRDNKYLIMVELKSRGGATSARSYPLKQLLNYIRLVAECQDSKSKDMPEKFIHIIIMPSSERKWLDEHASWVTDIKQNMLYVNKDACIKLGNKYTKQNAQRIRKLLSKIPIYYCSWQQLGKAFDSAVIEFDDRRNRNHWKKIGNELKDLSEVACRFAKGSDTES